MLQVSATEYSHEEDDMLAGRSPPIPEPLESQGLPLTNPTGGVQSSVHALLWALWFPVASRSVSPGSCFVGVTLHEENCHGNCVALNGAVLTHPDLSMVSSMRRRGHGFGVRVANGVKELMLGARKHHAAFLV
jgi:hypothetical protein